MFDHVRSIPDRLKLFLSVTQESIQNDQGKNSQMILFSFVLLYESSQDKKRLASYEMRRSKQDIHFKLV